MSNDGMIDAPSQAACRLADEYDAAQQRGEVAGANDGRRRSQTERLPSAADIGLTRKQVHEATMFPVKNKVATVADIGLTRKQVHEARRGTDGWREARQSACHCS
jgi:uncharacterized protein YjiS (DUF1127 family)